MHETPQIISCLKLIKLIEFPMRIALLANVSIVLH